MRVTDRADGSVVKETHCFTENLGDTITLWGTPGLTIQQLRILGGRWAGNTYGWGSFAMIGEPPGDYKLEINFKEENKIVLKDINRGSREWDYEFGIMVKHEEDQILWDPEVRERPPGNN